MTIKKIPSLVAALLVLASVSTPVKAVKFGVSNNIIKYTFITAIPSPAYISVRCVYRKDTYQNGVLKSSETIYESGLLSQGCRYGTWTA